MKNYKYFIILLIPVLFLFSCGDSGSGSKDPTAEDYIVEGWEFFDADDMVSAETSFRNAITTDATVAGAYSGLGWILALNKNFSEAITTWESGIALEANNADINAGLTVVYQATDELEECIASGLKVVNNNPGYSFTHDTDINEALIRGLMASAYFGLQQYDNAATQMDTAVPANAPHSSADLEVLLKAIMDYLGLQ